MLFYDLNKYQLSFDSQARSLARVHVVSC